MFASQISFSFLLILFALNPLLFVICPFRQAAACRWLVLSRSYPDVLCCLFTSAKMSGQLILPIIFFAVPVRSQHVHLLLSLLYLLFFIQKTKADF